MQYNQYISFIDIRIYMQILMIFFTRKRRQFFFMSLQINLTLIIRLLLSLKFNIHHFSIYHTMMVTPQTRSSMLDVLTMEYIRTARVKGCTDRRIQNNKSFRNAIIPSITYLWMFRHIICSS